MPSKQEMFVFFNEKLLYIELEQLRENRVRAAFELFSYILDHFDTFDEYASIKLVDSIYKKCNEILSDELLIDYEELLEVCETLQPKLAYVMRIRIARSYGTIASQIFV